MEKSKIKFSNPEMLDIVFRVNNDFETEDEETEISTGVSSRHALLSDSSAVVQLRIEIGDETVSQPFHLITTFQAHFDWDPVEFPDEKSRDTILNTNAVLLLLSYARPSIAMVTNFSKYSSYNLPFLDLRD